MQAFPLDTVSYLGLLPYIFTKQVNTPSARSHIAETVLAIIKFVFGITQFRLRCPLHINLLDRLSKNREEEEEKENEQH